MSRSFQRDLPRTTERPIRECRYKWSDSPLGLCPKPRT